MSLVLDTDLLICRVGAKTREWVTSVPQGFCAVTEEVGDGSLEINCKEQKTCTLL